ncbi:MAG TPA: phosphoribosylformylglycinamidine synthase subunit PurL [Dehalococcoidia bacterium]
MVDQRTLDEIALSREEYELAVRRLGREPNPVELGMIGALWSEHCGYKNSKPLLRLFPTGTGNERVLTRVGQENAGAVDIGDGLCVVMKIESHNHPSAIEPFQGAATGVGGIVRDIFAMGARPVAILDSLRFGPLTDPRNRWLFQGVVSGIGGYGNCLGIPTVGGEVQFAEPYSGNPLVNAMCVGVARIGGLVSARAEGPGNVLMLVGADTGRDGIHGATFASVELDEASEERRPAVQVGNPFLEKLLMEACLELAEQHRDWIVGMQDLGAAGLTSAAVECAARAGTGVVIDVGRVPRREAGMTPYEVMLSESQERMLVIARRGYEDRVAELFRRWELHAVAIGHVTDDGMVRVLDGEREVAALPATLLTEPPEYRRQGALPLEVEVRQNFIPLVLPDITAEEANAVLLALVRSPNVASKRWVWRQYDHQVLTNTVMGPGGDAAVLRIKGTRRGIALATDGNGRYVWLDPYAGGAIAVAEAARNVVCVGAEPVAVTDCLNFGNPEKPGVYYHLEHAVRGMAEACRELGTPVISGNVSLYNETMGEAVYPTPVVGMLGVLEDVSQAVGAGFRQEGDAVYLIGGRWPAHPDHLAASEFLKVHHNIVAGRPSIDLDLERRVQRLCLESIRNGWAVSAHDCSDGGLAVALAECCMEGGLGLDASLLELGPRLDAALFGEEQSRIVVSLRPEAQVEFIHRANQLGVTVTYLGEVQGDRLRIGGAVDVAVAELTLAYERAIPDLLAGAAAGAP